MTTEPYCNHSSISICPTQLLSMKKYPLKFFPMSMEGKLGLYKKLKVNKTQTGFENINLLSRLQNISLE